MSKASEWAAREPPACYIAGVGQVAQVDRSGRMNIVSRREGSFILTQEQALVFADWLYDVFGAAESVEVEG